jgi:hypothetical protein
MKIYFVLGGIEQSLLHPSKYTKKLARNLKLVTTWQEIQEADLNYLRPSYQQYLIFKLLEHNEYFWKEIKTARKKLKLPESGLTWEQSRLLNYSTFSKKPDKYMSIIDEYGSLTDRWKIRDEIERKIKHNLELHPFIVEELPGLIESNYIAPAPINTVGWSTSQYDERNDEFIDDPSIITKPDGITINISEKISKNQLLSFIEKNWNEIDKINQKLPTPDSFTLSDRDLEIYQLRQQALTYKAIVDQIVTK